MLPSGRFTDDPNNLIIFAPFKSASPGQQQCPHLNLFPFL
ncbi:hypothetical protein AVDCRST_MAG84-618 [uncultured Microcoleus sp.]|uniref:Uncharacterized protein n=1 Tax=uncultured Microcoleus sp. TaxID=259945 RepID=A0A6J4KLN4_9CYAN|nr:hypothetical protein AVDCRST_MAG84-618 [uncultured Microcoleus sp.]